MRTFFNVLEVVAELAIFVAGAGAMILAACIMR